MLKSNLIQSIEFGTAVARRLKRALDKYSGKLSQVALSPYKGDRALNQLPVAISDVGDCQRFLSLLKVSDITFGPFTQGKIRQENRHKLYLLYHLCQLIR